MSTPIETIIANSCETVEGTVANGEFVWREVDGVKVLVSVELEAAGFINGFSTRLGGVSPFPDGDLNLAGFNEDTADNIHENRRRFLAALGTDHELALAWQVHGSDIRAVAKAEDVGDSNEHADAVVSDLPGVLAGVKTADCVPILLADTRTGAYAAVHAGWRGTVRSIAAKAIETMQSRFGSDPSDILAVIGPSAGCSRYEVGEDVIEDFRTHFETGEKYFSPTTPGHALIDLWAANRDQLVDAGVDSAKIYISGYCTITRVDLFFSYRIEKKANGKTGRLMSVIGRR